MANFWFQPALRIGAIALAGLAVMFWDATAGMLVIALGMLRKVLDAFARLDAVAAAAIIREDRAIDDEFRSILRQLITFMMEDPRTISMAIEIVFIAKAIERIGDHAKNIAEYVIYIVKGTDVRHTSYEFIEREAQS